MTDEIRVYIADSTSYFMNLDEDTEIGIVMDCAEAQGTVYTLPNFIHAINNGEVDLSGENTIIRMAEYKDNEFIKEIK